MIIHLDVSMEYDCYFKLSELSSSSALGLTCLPYLHYLKLCGGPSPSTSSLTCFIDPHYLGLGWLRSPSALDLACLLDPCYLRLGGWPSPSTLDLKMFVRLTLLHSLGCANRGWSFIWVCPRKDVWEDDYYLEFTGLPSKCLESNMFVRPTLP
jgi:hypothetical protein